MHSCGHASCESKVKQKIQIKAHLRTVFMHKVPQAPRCSQKEVVIHYNELAAEARNAMHVGLYGVAVEGGQVSRFWEDT
jgi:hypothetical protein